MKKGFKNKIKIILLTFLSLNLSFAPIALAVTSSGSDTGKTVAVDFATCTGASVLGQFASSVISSTFGSIMGSMSQLVPTNDRPSNIADVGQASPDGNAIVWPGWTAVQVCIVNSIITAITQSTIAWIKGGFKGNGPVFLTNPEQMLQTIADREFQTFMNSIDAGAFCQDWRPQIKINLQKIYNSGYRSGFPAPENRCTIDEAIANFEGVLDDTARNWIIINEYGKNPYNEPNLVLQRAAEEIDKKIVTQQGLATWEINLGDGFYSWKDKNGEIQTPGKVIQTQVEETLNIPKERLVLADRFDEVVTVLVQTLIKTALNETLGGDNYGYEN